MFSVSKTPGEIYIMWNLCVKWTFEIYLVKYMSESGYWNLPLCEMYTSEMNWCVYPDDMLSVSRTADEMYIMLNVHGK